MMKIEVLKKCRQELLRIDEIKDELKDLKYIKGADTTSIYTGRGHYVDFVGDMVSKEEELKNELKDLEQFHGHTGSLAMEIVSDLPLKYFKVAMTYYCYGMSIDEVRKVARCNRVRKYLTDIEKILT